MDFEEFLPAQQSFELAGSLPERLDGQRDRRTASRSATPAPTRPRTFLPSLGIAPMMGRDFTADGQQAGRREGGAHRLRASGSAISAASPDIVGKNVRINGKPATIIGVMPKGFAFPANEELWLPLYPASFRRGRASDPANINPGGPRPRSSPACRSDQANAEFTGARAAVRRGLPGHEQAVQHRRRSQRLIEIVHAAGAARHHADDARLLRRRAADRVRQRDEHAVRARDAARQGAGGSIVARRHPHPADAPDADREPARRDASARSVGIGLAVLRDRLAASRPCATSTTRRPS